MRKHRRDMMRPVDINHCCMAVRCRWFAGWYGVHVLCQVLEGFHRSCHSSLEDELSQLKVERPSVRVRLLCLPRNCPPMYPFNCPHKAANIKCLHVYKQACMYAYMHACLIMHTCIHMHTSAYHVYIYVHRHMSMFLCIHTYIHAMSCVRA